MGIGGSENITMERQQAILIASYKAVIMNEKRLESRYVPFELELRHGIMTSSSAGRR